MPAHLSCSVTTFRVPQVTASHVRRTIISGGSLSSHIPGGLERGASIESVNCFKLLTFAAGDCFAPGSLVHRDTAQGHREAGLLEGDRGVVEHAVLASELRPEHVEDLTRAYRVVPRVEPVALLRVEQLGGRGISDQPHEVSTRSS